MSVEMYRKYFTSGYQQIFGLIRKKAPNIRILFHSCGAAYEMIPELVQLGIDILNPVQVSAANMDTKRLKKEFAKISHSGEVG
jgi:uroporphyrinogen decarboxylase